MSLGMDLTSRLSFPHLSREWKPDKVIICYMTMHLQRHVPPSDPLEIVEPFLTLSQDSFERNELVLAPNPLTSGGISQSRSQSK